MSIYHRDITPAKIEDSGMSNQAGSYSFLVFKDDSSRLECWKKHEAVRNILERVSSSPMNRDNQ